ncbi:MAG: DNA polymerase IV [Acidobacteriota bacterium]
MRQRWIAHIDIDAFFAAVEVLLDPSLKGKPVVVGGLPHERGVASTASYEARKYGVHSGMSLHQAYRFCPHGIFLRGNYRLYQAFSQKFFRLLSSYTPDVEAASLDEAYLELTRCGHLYPSFSRIVREIKQRVEKELGLTVSVGAGPNKLLAKLATNRAKPGGLFEITPGSEDEFLSSLPVEFLPGIGAKTQAVLRLLNIRRIGDLRGLPRTSLRSLFGLNGEELYLQARGVDSRPVLASSEAKSISRETTFLGNIWEERLLLAHLAYLCDRLALALRKERLYAHIIEVKIRYSDFRTESRRRLLLMPLQDMGEIYRVARELFRSLFPVKKTGASLAAAAEKSRPGDTREENLLPHRPGFRAAAGKRPTETEKSRPRERRGTYPLALRLLGVKASDLASARSLSLFEPCRERQEKLGSAVYAVREKYGFGSVLTVREKMLDAVYDFEIKRGYVLKTASLTK